MQRVLKKPENRQALTSLLEASEGVASYDVLSIIQKSHHKKTTLTRLLNDIQSYGADYIWHEPEYDEYRAKEEEDDFFQTHPTDVEDGVIECVCGSKKTVSHQRQTRSADEGATTFIRCVVCKRSWRQNN